MGTVLNQVSFASGEISPRLFARVDISRFQSALSTCKNFIPRPYGGVENRPGLQFLNECKLTQATRLIPFQFSTVQTYVLEMGNQYIRFYKDGGLVVIPDGEPNAGDPVEVSTPWNPEDLDLIKYTQSADVMYFVHPDYPPQTLSRTDVDQFELAPFDYEEGPFQPQNIDDSVAIYSDGYEGVVTLTSTKAIFDEDMENSFIKLSQSLDIAVKSWEVSKSVVVGDQRAASGHYYEARNAATTGTLRPSHIEGVESDGAVEWEYIHSGFGIVRIQQYISPTSVKGEVVSRLPNSVVGAAGTPQPITGLAFIEDPPGYDFYYPQITAVGHGFDTNDNVLIEGVTGTHADKVNGLRQVTKIDNDTLRLKDGFATNAPSANASSATVAAGAGSIENQPTPRWAMGAWSDLTGYPGTVNFFQQRLIFAATPTQPQTFWMSVIDAFNSFQKHLPLLDDDSIEGTIAARQVNTIRHIVALNDLIFNTSGAEYKMTPGDNGVVPGGVSIDPQSFYGASDVTPITTGTVALFVQEKGTVIRDLGYSFDVDGYSGSNLSQLSEHMFRGRRVKDWAYSQVPWDAIFLVMDDGSMLSLTYVRDQQVIGWARHETDGLFESVTTVSEGDEDAVYFVVRRMVEGVEKRFVERMAVREAGEIEKAFFVDSGLSYDGTITNGASMTLEAYGEATAYAAATDGYSAGTYSGFTLNEAKTYVFELAMSDTLPIGAEELLGGLSFVLISGSSVPVFLNVQYNRDGTHTLGLAGSGGSVSLGSITNNSVVGVYINVVTGKAGAVVDGTDSGEILDVSINPASEYGLLAIGQSQGIGDVTGGAEIEVRTEAGSIAQTYPGTPYDLCGNLLSGGGTSCVHIFSGEEADPLGYDRMTVTGGNTLSFSMSPSATGEGWGNVDRIYKLTASASTFEIQDTDDAIVFPDVEGRPLFLTIKEFVSGTEARVQASFTPPLSLDGVPRTDWAFARNRLTGMAHLEGKTVSILADGNVHPQLVVEDGAIELQYPASVVHAGLPFESEIQTLPVSSAEVSVRDKLKNIRKVSMIVQETRGGFAGSGGKLYEVKPDYRDMYDIPLPPNSGIQEIHVQSMWGYQGIVTVRQTDPLPMSILSIMPDITMGGAS